jgi:hypothetical protein
VHGRRKLRIDESLHVLQIHYSSQDFLLTNWTAKRILMAKENREKNAKEKRTQTLNT